MKRFNKKHKPKHTTKVKFQEVYDRCPKLPVMFYTKTQTYTYSKLQPMTDIENNRIVRVKHVSFKFGNYKYRILG